MGSFGKQEADLVPGSGPKLRVFLLEECEDGAEYHIARGRNYAYICDSVWSNLSPSSQKLLLNNLRNPIPFAKHPKHHSPIKFLPSLHLTVRFAL